MKFMLFYLPAVGSRSQIESGFAGQKTQNYQNMLWQITEQLQAADDMGFWGAAFTEHHFHIEGFEASNNPIMLSLYFGLKTRNIRMGQMANVLPFHNPLRLAEDLSMLDQMLRGRSFVGFARGYQKRWADVMGQVYNVGATLSDKSEMDDRNRKLFEEHYEIIMKAWTSQTFSHKSDHWEIPPAGIEFPHGGVKKWGAGLGDDNILTEIGIAPRPYQKPHPQVFQPFSFSPETFRFCAREGIAPIAIFTDDDALEGLLKTYKEEAAEHGRSFEIGQNIGIFRDCFVQKDAATAHAYAQNGNGFVWPEWFGPLGFDEAFRRKGETGKIKADYKEMVDRGFEFVGTPDEINRRIENMVKRHNPEYLLMWQYPGQIPHDAQMRHLELWATEIMPNWTD